LESVLVPGFMKGSSNEPFMNPPNAAVGGLQASC
jgi:hypothetical protein